MKNGRNYKDSHTTRDPRFAEDWGVHRKFLLFPQHLPDLYLPTKKSFKQTLRESTDTGLAARWISLFPTWLQFILSTVALSVSLGVMIFLYILILFQQGLTPSDLKDLDGERIWAVASKTGASGASIFAGMGFIFCDLEGELQHKMASGFTPIRRNGKSKIRKACFENGNGSTATF